MSFNMINKELLGDIPNILDNLGLCIQTDFNNIYCGSDTNNDLVDYTLTKGLWLVVGTFQYDGANLRYAFSNGIKNVSGYDSGGYVFGNNVQIENITEDSKKFTAKFYPTAKSVTISGKIIALKIK